MFESLINKAKSLVCKYGPEVGAVAKIAAHALIPGAPLIVGSVEALCDYNSEKGHEIDHAELIAKLESLGGDTAYLEKVLNQLTGQLDGVIGMMAQSSQFGATPEMMEAMINSALENQFSALRDELRALTPELETVKRQGEALLRGQSLQGDMLSQVQESLDAALAFNAPLAGEGVVGPQVSLFLAARGRFQSALLNGDLAGAEAALGQMKTISPNGNTYRVSEMALRAAKKDFEGAEQVARTITGVDDPRLQRARASLTKLTRASMGSAQTPPPQEARYDVGSSIGDKGWVLTDLLGRGGMGSVWRAKNSRGQEGAVKLMSAALSSDAQFVSRFQAEIDSLDKVTHASVVEVLDWGYDRLSGAWYFVMPFLKGASLRARLRQGALEPKSVKALARSLAGALVACHSKGVIHRDIKPENVMLREDGSPVLIDFGIAHQEGLSTGQTSMATGGYAPPEQLAGRAVDATADLFALGMTLAECLGSKAGEGMWRELIGQLTHFMPSARGTAVSLLERLSEAPKKYHASLPGASPEGPLSVDEVVARVLGGADRLMLWWQGQAGWSEWGAVAEVKARVEAKREVSPPPLSAQVTPPPPPPPRLSAGDRVSSKVGAVSFHERVIPAPPGGKSFLMMETQVTQALYEAVMGTNPSHFKGAQKPVEKVSWEDGVKFANALSRKLGLTPAYEGSDNNARFNEGANGFRLPFEAEWEFAAKGGQGFKYAGSDNLSEVGWYDQNSGGSTHDVAKLKPNGYGVNDMSGNVWEWCADDYDNPGQYRPGAGERVNRGGGWLRGADDCGVTCRYWYSPGDRNRGLGLRLSRSVR